MPWSYDPSRPPDQRFQWWGSDQTTPPDTSGGDWPEPRHRLAADPAEEALAVAAALVDGLTALVRDALDRLDEIDRRD